MKEFKIMKDNRILRMKGEVILGAILPFTQRLRDKNGDLYSNPVWQFYPKNSYDVKSFNEFKDAVEYAHGL